MNQNKITESSLVKKKWMLKLPMRYALRHCDVIRVDKKRPVHYFSGQERTRAASREEATQPTMYLDIWA
jgi:hypothetical protein